MSRNDNKILNEAYGGIRETTNDEYTAMMRKAREENERRRPEIQAKIAELEDIHGPLDWSSTEIENIEMSDYPDFANAFLTNIAFEDGTWINDIDENLVEYVEDLDRDAFYNAIIDKIH